MHTREETDALWSMYVGSRHMFDRDELRILKELREAKVLPIQQINRLYLTSRYWRKIRYRVLARDNFTCLKCGSQAQVHVDHIAYGEMGEEKMSDLQTLCWHCHMQKTTRRDMFANKDLPQRRVDVSGDHLYMATRRSDLYGGKSVRGAEARGDKDDAVAQEERGAVEAYK